MSNAFEQRSHLSIGGFLRKSRKYGLGPLKKTPTEGTPPIGPGPTSGQLAFNLQPTNQIEFFLGG